VVDAFWFIRVAERFDQATAETINEQVWARVAGMAAKDLVARFKIQENGLEGFVKVMKLFPWCILVGYQISQTDEMVTISVAILSNTAGTLEARFGGVCVQRNASTRVSLGFAKHNRRHASRWNACSLPPIHIHGALLSVTFRLAHRRPIPSETCS